MMRRVIPRDSFPAVNPQSPRPSDVLAHRHSPSARWSQPAEAVVERLPVWVWCLLLALLLLLAVLVAHIRQLHRQRERFLATMKHFPSASEAGGAPASPEEHAERHPADPLPSDGEPSWLQQAISQVEAHLSDESYSVEVLASDLCMSRMTFYRKIQTATGQKPTEFIRTIRLRRAAELLREGQLSVTEVTFATGFSSVSYFSRCFRTMFGVPPTHYK